MTDAERALLLSVAECQTTMATAFGWKDKAEDVRARRDAVVEERKAVPAEQQVTP